MSVLIATGGLDEVAIDFSYMIFSAIFVVVAGLTALSWRKHWLAPGKVAFVLILTGGALIEPWKFIISPKSVGPYPYDRIYLNNMRDISIVWLLLFIFTTAQLARAVSRNRKLNKDTANAA
jgi:hypothetical protein